MKINIDFDELLNKSIEASIKACNEMYESHPEHPLRIEQLSSIATISAQTTVLILRDYHAQLEKILQACDTTQ